MAPRVPRETNALVLSYDPRISAYIEEALHHLRHMDLANEEARALARELPPGLGGRMLRALTVAAGASCLASSSVRMIAWVITPEEPVAAALIETEEPLPFPEAAPEEE